MKYGDADSNSAASCAPSVPTAHTFSIRNRRRAIHRTFLARVHTLRTTTSLHVDDIGIKTLCGLPCRLAGRGFRVSWQIPMVRYRRERLLDHESRCRRAVFARHPYRFCFCHWLSPGPVVLVRQLRGPHLSTCPWCSKRSSMAETAALSPSSLPQSSSGRFDVSKVLARS